jgi:hypothetical protein
MWAVRSTADSGAAWAASSGRCTCPGAPMIGTTLAATVLNDNSSAIRTSRTIRMAQV